MTPEYLFFRYAWLIMLLGVGLSTVRLWIQARNPIAKNPELRAGYQQLYKGFAISMGLPWLVMGIGTVLGGVPSFVEFFQPRNGNLFVLVFWLTIVVLIVLGFWWVYFRAGAEFLAKHPGALGMHITSPILVKTWMGLVLVSGSVMLVTFWFQ